MQLVYTYSYIEHVYRYVDVVYPIQDGNIPVRDSRAVRPQALTVRADPGPRFGLEATRQYVTYLLQAIYIYIYIYLYVYDLHHVTPMQARTQYRIVGR